MRRVLWCLLCRLLVLRTICGHFCWRVVLVCPSCRSREKRALHMAVRRRVGTVFPDKTRHFSDSAVAIARPCPRRRSHSGQVHGCARLFSVAHVCPPWCSRSFCDMLSTFPRSWTRPSPRGFNGVRLQSSRLATQSTCGDSCKRERGRLLFTPKKFFFFLAE